MSNTLTGLVPILYEAMNIVSREQTGLVRAVGRDSSADMVALGQEVRTPIVRNYEAADITPGVTAPDVGDQTVDYVSTTIEKSRSVPVRWNGEEMKGTALVDSIMRDQFAEAMRTLVNEVEADLAATAKAGASRAVGTAGTTPFATKDDLSDFAIVNEVLDNNGAPTSERHLVTSSAAMANLRGKQAVLFRVNEAGSSDLLRQGIIGQVQGLNLHNSSFIKQHTAGTGSGYLVNSTGALTEGTTTIPLDTGSGTILAGDVLFEGTVGSPITPANDVRYVAKSAFSAPSVEINKPGLEADVANDAPFEIVGNYTPNFAFHRSAIQLVTRAPAMPAGGDAASDVMDVLDPNTGLVFQVAMYRQYRQIAIHIGLAWGYSVIKPEHIVTLMG